VSFSTIIISKSHNYYALQELKEIHVANESMRLAPGANHGPKFSKAVSPRSQVKYIEYIPEDWKVYGTENSPAKAARHFSQLLGGKLPWAYIVLVMSFFWLRDQLAKFQFLQI